MTQAHSAGNEVVTGAVPAVSVVIPVFNSAGVVVGTVNNLITELAKADISFEIVLVDDGSKDGSWLAVSDLIRTTPGVRGIRFLRNRGQHSALLAGIRASRGSYVVLMDDDGQNPAAEIPALLQEARRGYDLVFGAADDKKHAFYRNLGSNLVNRLAERLFQKPASVRVSNFKVLSRALADRIGEYASDRPNINAEALLYCTSVTSIPVRHETRRVGDSQYTLRGLLALLSRLLIGYSLLPLRAIIGIGLLVGLLGLAIGLASIAHGLYFGTNTPGWTSIVVLLSVMQSTALIGLSVVGEYTMRALERVEGRAGYVVIEEA